MCLYFTNVFFFFLLTLFKMSSFIHIFWEFFHSINLLPYLRGQHAFGFIDGTSPPFSSTHSNSYSCRCQTYYHIIGNPAFLTLVLTRSDDHPKYTHFITFWDHSVSSCWLLHYFLGAMAIPWKNAYLPVPCSSLNDYETVSYLLARLGYEYDHFGTSITTRVDSLSLNELYVKLLLIPKV
jgi:hypothetical protein